MMKVSKNYEVPLALVRASKKFALWRESRQRGTRVPDSLWKLAVQLAEVYGVSRTALALKIGFYALRKRVQRDAGQQERTCAASGQVGELLTTGRDRQRFDSNFTSRGSHTATSAFVELSTDAAQASNLSDPPPACDCLIEFEKVSGAKLRIHFKGNAIPDVLNLGRNFWEAR